MPTMKPNRKLRLTLVFCVIVALLCAILLPVEASIRRNPLAFALTAPFAHAYRVLLHELGPGIGSIGHRLRRGSIINDYLRSHQVRMLQIGAGRNVRAGWLNTDIQPGPGVVFLDAREPFPFEDGSFRYVAAEHVFEHLTYEQGRHMLRESYRILQSRGRVRIITPDLLRLVALWDPNKSPEAVRYLDEKIRRHNWPAIVTPQCVIVNHELREFGHKFVYDGETLRALLASTGFRPVQAAVGESEAPELRGFETPSRIWPHAYLYESMVWEGVKP